MGAPAAPATAAAGAPALEILTSFFAGLDRAGIRYCHWKSNEHLAASLSGGTDVDMLADRHHALPLARLLSELNCKRFLVKPGRGYPGIEDYLAFDGRSGALSHVHIHYQLTLGEHFLKGYRLPWEDLALATRVRDPATRVYVTDPHLELLILAVRAALKLRIRDNLKVLAQRRWPRGDMLREFTWLAGRIDRARLADVARPLVGPRAVVQLLGLLDESPPSFSRLRAFRDAARPGFGAYRLYSPTDARRRRWATELSVIWATAWDLVRQGRRISSRTSPHGGLAVACVGAPGAGAPELARHLARWLAHDAAVVHVPDTAGRDARARYRQALRIRRARGLGLIVVTDQITPAGAGGMAASPQSVHGGPSRDATREPSGRERELVEATAVLAPDLILRLNVSLDVARTRAPEVGEDRLSEGVRAVRDLRGPPGSRVVEIDADSAPETTLRQAQRAVWEAI